MVNITLVGRFVRKPQYHETTNEQKLTKFMIASKSSRYDNGEQITEFVKCVAWNKIADRIVQYCNQGDLVSITGELMSRKFQDIEHKTDKEVWEVYVNNIEFVCKAESKESKLPF